MPVKNSSFFYSYSYSVALLRVSVNDPKSNRLLPLLPFAVGVPRYSDMYGIRELGKTPRLHWWLRVLPYRRMNVFA